MLPEIAQLTRDERRGLGGLGLRMVAQLCDGHGWDTDGHRKVVWARIDYTSQ